MGLQVAEQDFALIWPTVRNDRVNLTNSACCAGMPPCGDRVVPA